MISLGRTKVAFYPPSGDLLGNNLRKMLECVLQGKAIKGLIYLKGKQPQTKLDEMSVNEQPRDERRDERRTEAVLVKKTGKTYAELLKDVKEKVKVGTEAKYVNLGTVKW